MTFKKKLCDLLDSTFIGYVSTASKDGNPNTAIKGLINYDAEAQTVCFLDLFEGQTERNLLANPRISVVVVDNEKFIGFKLRGKAEISNTGEEFEKCCFEWQVGKHNRYQSRIKGSISKFLKADTSEYSLPKPKHLVKIYVEEITDMIPDSMKKL